MGIGSNEMVEIAEQEHQEYLHKIVCYNAAELVVDGMSRSEAMQKAQDDMNDYFDEINSGIRVEEDSEEYKFSKDKQVIAIANELLAESI